MDRVIVYDAALPQTTDVLNTNKFAMIGHAFLAASILGSSTVVSGLACNPTSPASLQVTIGEGAIYQIDEVDATAYGDLGTDTNSILKQGILYSPATLTITPPTTTGYSQVFLVQAILSDVDGGSQVLNYYNAANPDQPYSGPGNDGQSQYTTRTCVCTIALKAGVAAPTGTQVTPSPDAGYTGLYAITVANGQATITSPNISQLSTAPFFPTLPAIPSDVQDSAWIYCTDSSAGGSPFATTSGTTTSSAVLNFGANNVPSWVAVGMKAYDLTTPNAISGSQTVQSINLSAGTVTLTANVNAAVSSGDVIAFSNNTYVGAISPPPAALVPGLCVRVKINSTNTGAATFNLNGLGAVAIHRANSSAVQAGDLAANMIAQLIYDGSAWQVANFEGFSAGTTNNNTYSINIPYCTDSSGSANTVTANFSPAISSLSAGNVVLVKIANTNTGATTITVNSLAAVNVVGRGGGALQAGELVQGQVALLVFDGTNFQIANFGSTLGLQIYSVAGTYTFTVPAGVYLLEEVELWGAGGGGACGYPSGGSGPTSGGGGASGGYANKHNIVVTPGQNITVVVGAHGVGVGAGVYNTNGGNGGTTSFGSVFSATGGSGGSYATAGGCGSWEVSLAPAGSGAGGDINITGQPGGPGTPVTPAISQTGGGKGGAPPIWGVGVFDYYNGPVNATAPGGGGMGGPAASSGTSWGGGNGADGFVRIKWRV